MRWMFAWLMIPISVAGQAQAASPAEAADLDTCRQELRQLREKNGLLESQVQDQIEQLRQAGQNGGDAQRAPIKPLDAGGLSETGYAATRWGMSMAEVRKIYPAGRIEKASGDLSLGRKVAERQAKVVFRFKKDRLTAVQVSFDAITFSKVHELMNEYKRMEELLGLKYGSSQSDAPDSQSRAGTEPAALSRSVSQGRVHLTTAWETPLTRVVLSCDGQGHKLSMNVDYESMELLLAEQQRLLKDL